MTEAWRIRITHWQDDQPRLATIRAEVFIREQQVPETLEWDEHDESAVHILAETSTGAAIGTARLLPDGHLGRMAVLRDWRGRGVGSAMLQALLTQARQQGLTSVILSAQLHAIGFYERHGFSANGPEFIDAGIPHRWMTRSLQEHVNTMNENAGYQIGANSALLRLDGRLSTREHATRMVQQARRALHLFTPDLDPAIYDDSEFLEALKQLALRSPRTEAKVLLVDPGRAVREGHRIVELMRRLSSHISIYRVHRDFQNRGDTFLIVDGTAYMRRPDYTRYEGVAQYHDPGEAGVMLRQFATMWEKSAPEPEFRRLHI